MSDKYTDKRLLKLSRSSGKFINLEVGDSFIGTYITWKAVTDEKYNKLKPEFVFRNENGEDKILGTSAKKFGTRMSHIVPGSKVQIIRLGEGQKTDYSVKVLKMATMPQDVDEDDEEEEEDEDEIEEKPKKKLKKKVVEEDEDDEDDEEEEEDELFSK